MESELSHRLFEKQKTVCLTVLLIHSVENDEFHCSLFFFFLIIIYIYVCTLIQMKYLLNYAFDSERFVRDSEKEVTFYFISWR